MFYWFASKLKLPVGYALSSSPTKMSVLHWFIGKFRLTVHPGEFTDSEIIVMLGENGTGKTTFIKMLAGKLTPDEGGGSPLLCLPQLFTGFQLIWIIQVACLSKTVVKGVQRGPSAFDCS